MADCGLNYSCALFVQERNTCNNIKKQTATDEQCKRSALLFTFTKFAFAFDTVGLIYMKYPTHHKLNSGGESHFDFVNLLNL